MNTIVTCLFQDREHAAAATQRLSAAGYTIGQMRTIEAHTPDRRAFITLRTRDGRRAAMLGAAFGCLGGSAAGALLGVHSGMLQAALIGAAVATFGGTLLGILVGFVTASQMKNELDSLVQAGSVLVSVTSDAAHGPDLLGLMVRDGGATMVSSATTFTAGTLSSEPQ